MQCEDAEKVRLALPFRCAHARAVQCPALTSRIITFLLLMLRFAALEARHRAHPGLRPAGRLHRLLSPR
eukprot:2182081-Rhodomonas_salina.2